MKTGGADERNSRQVSPINPVQHWGNAGLNSGKLSFKGHLAGYRLPTGSLNPIVRHGHHYIVQQKEGLTIAGPEQTSGLLMHYRNGILLTTATAHLVSPEILADRELNQVARAS